MDGSPVHGPASLLLMASVARKHYVNGESKLAIAAETGMSRFKVARLLDQARSCGLVRIEIGYPGVIDVELSGQVQDTFGLSHAVVLRVPDDDEGAVRAHVGHAAAELLSEIVGPSDVLGLTWSRSVTAMVGQITRLAAVPVVQLCGALAQTYGDKNSVELVRQVARVAGGPAYFFYVPMIVGEAATATALGSQPEVRNAFAQFPRVTKAVAGIGLWAPGKSTVYDSVSEHDRAELAEQGVCAEIAGVFMDVDGQFVPTHLSNRVVGVDGAQLQAIPEVIGVPYDHTKAVAVRAALRSGIINGLVTHTSMASALLALGR